VDAPLESCRSGEGFFGRLRSHMSDRPACGDVVRRYRRVPQAAQCPWAVMRGFASLEPNRVAERTGESNAEFLFAAIDSALRQEHHFALQRYSDRIRCGGDRQTNVGSGRLGRLRAFLF